MNKTLEQIVKLLPEGLSETGIGEICSLIEQAINDEVAEQQELLESKVTSFLNSKIDDLKEVARIQIVQESSELRDLAALGKIKALAASLVPGNEFESIARESEDKIADLETRIVKLNEMIEEQSAENTENEKLLDEATYALTTLTEELEELESSYQDGLLSEMTEMPRKGDSLLEEDSYKDFAVENDLLTEEMVKLSRD